LGKPVVNGQYKKKNGDVFASPFSLIAKVKSVQYCFHDFPKEKNIELDYSLQKREKFQICRLSHRHTAALTSYL